MQKVTLYAQALAFIAVFAMFPPDRVCGQAPAASPLKKGDLPDRSVQAQASRPDVVRASGRGGVGNIDAKQPDGIEYAQGQNTTFTLMVGSGARYNFGSKYAVTAGATYMHVSDFYLSEPRYEDFGINVWGPIVGVYMRIGKPKQHVVY